MLPSGFKRIDHLSFIDQFSKKHKFALPDSEKLEFYKKGQLLVILVQGMIQPLRSGSFLKIQGLLL